MNMTAHAIVKALAAVYTVDTDQIELIRLVRAAQSLEATRYAGTGHGGTLDMRIAAFRAATGGTR